MPRKTPPALEARVRECDRFNEAAARCRGKLTAVQQDSQQPTAASMRPRPDAAENMPFRIRSSAAPDRFNEAAARCRGKL